MDKNELAYYIKYKYTKRVTEEQHKKFADINGYFSGFYLYTTENIRGYMQPLKLKNKKVLTVGSSMDHTFNLVSKGCKDITVFDVNPFTKEMFELKKAAIKNLKKDEFLDFFVYNNAGRRLDVNTYKKIRKDINLEERVFWDKQFSEDEYRNIDKLIKYDNFSKDEVKKYNMYLDDDKYYEITENLKNCNIKFVNGDVTKMFLKDTYDYMFLSNISQYVVSSIRDYKEYLKIMKYFISNAETFLNKDGKMYYAYLYNMDETMNMLDGIFLVYDIKFNKENIKNTECNSFAGVNPHPNDDNTDSTLVYTKKCL